MATVNDVASLLRLDDAAWKRTKPEDLPRLGGMVVAAFALAAWNRFGPQAPFAPRAPVQMILIGIYGWLGLTLLTMGLAAIIAHRQRRSTEVNNTGPTDQTLGASLKSTVLDASVLQRSLAALALPHLPLIVVGLYVGTVGAFFRLPLVSTVLAIVAFGLWMPLLLGRALRQLLTVVQSGELGRPSAPNMRIPSATLVMIGPYVLWLATIGRYLFQQVGHTL